MTTPVKIRGGRDDSTDASQTWLYVAVIAVEAIVLVGLWALGRHFGA